jgi:CheY-like chemotaxis protein
VKLHAEDVQPSAQSTVCTYVNLTITDSGQGMSPEYMRTKLFTPFAQESSITPGTGLGLSLVKSIVNMLNGEIEVTSTLDVGSTVVVRLPMTKISLHASSSGSTSTPSTAGSSAERVKDSSIRVVQTEASRWTVATYWKERVSDTDAQRDSSVMMRETVDVYLNDWYGFKACSWDKSLTWDVVVTEETDIHELIAEAPYLSEPNCKTMVLILRNTTAPQMAKSSFPNCDNFEQIRHPFGPYKLARALRICLERLQSGLAKPVSGSNPTLARVDEDGFKPPVEDITARVENITLSSPNRKFPDVSIIRKGTTSAREDSVNAQMAMTPPETSVRSYPNVEYPFPHPSDRKDPRADGTVSPTAETELLAAHRPPMAPIRRTISTTHQEIRLKDLTKANAMSSLGALTNAPLSNPKPTNYPPRMLLVDDNRINLKLLQTFMKKRKSTNVTSAEDGLQAVNAYQSLLSKSLPPDIVLMDISMPVMNGFEATRRIREIERDHCAELSPMETPPSCLIIALTGLASARDQSEAFMSGFDMYITKPVSFAEISRLLDNWEANGGGNVKVPHGAVAADMDEAKKEMDKLVESERTEESHVRDNREKVQAMGLDKREELKGLILEKEGRSLDPERRVEKEVVVEKAMAIQDAENRKRLGLKTTKLDESEPDIELKLPEGLGEKTEMDTQTTIGEALQPEKEEENAVQALSPPGLSKPDTATGPPSALEPSLGVPELASAETTIADHHATTNPCAKPFTPHAPPSN